VRREMLFLKCERIEFNDFVSAAGLLQKGFREVEELVTWIRPTARFAYTNVKKATLKDAWRCMMIAKESFVYDRRHQDGNIPNWSADLSKMWAVGRGFWRRAFTVFVIERQEGHGVVGFISCVMYAPTARIDLIAVSRPHRRAAMAENLIAKALHYYGEQGCSHIFVGTQAHNTASCKLYESLGFVIGRRQRTFHK